MHQRKHYNKHHNFTAVSMLTATDYAPNSLTETA